MKVRGLVVAPQVAIGDGALGFWKAARRGVPDDASSAMLARTQTLNGRQRSANRRCNANAHKDLREIRLSPSRRAADSRR